MNVELSIPRESFPIKLMIKMCQENNVRMFSNIHQDLLTFTPTSTRLYQTIKHRLETDQILPTIDSLRDAGLGVDMSTITGTFNHYYEETLKAYRVLKLSALLEECSNNLIEEDFDKVNENLNACRTHMFKGSIQRHMLARTIEDVAEEIIIESNSAFINNNRGIITTGYEDLDELMYGGFLPGGLYAITGRPKQGKTSYLLHMAARAWIANKKVLILSGEMTVNEMAMKIISQYTNISVKDIIRGDVSTEGANQIREFAQEASNSDFYLKPITQSSTMQDVELAVREFEPDALYVDSAHLIYAKEYKTGWQPKSHELVTNTVNALKELAIKQNIPVIATTHLNRNAETGKKRRRNAIEIPDSSAIAGSDAWSKAASIIFAIIPALQEEQKVLHMMMARNMATKDYLLSFKPDIPMDFSLMTEFNVQEHQQNVEQAQTQRNNMRRTQAVSASESFSWMDEIENQTTEND